MWGVHLLGNRECRVSIEVKSGDKNLTDGVIILRNFFSNPNYVYCYFMYVQ